MTERPVLFQADMVRAVLSGAKTQTRRVVTPVPHADWHPAELGPLHKNGPDGLPDPDRPWGWGACDGDGLHGRPCPYGAPGDRLWVREAFRLSEAHEHRSPAEAAPARDRPFVPPVRCEADLSASRPSPVAWGRLRPSIHMPRWASRLTLEVTDVRVERVQDISEADALAEGVPKAEVEPMDDQNRPLHWISTDDKSGSQSGHATARAAFAHLWNTINGARGYAWAEDPFVWVVGFRRAPSAEGAR